MSLPIHVSSCCNAPVVMRGHIKRQMDTFDEPHCAKCLKACAKVRRPPKKKRTFQIQYLSASDVDKSPLWHSCKTEGCNRRIFDKATLCLRCQKVRLGGRNTYSFKVDVPKVARSVAEFERIVRKIENEVRRNHKK